MDYVIGSFNIRNFSGDGQQYIYGKGGTKYYLGDRYFNDIAKIIKEEGFNIVALQEVMDGRAVETLKHSLNIMGRQKWRSSFAMPDFRRDAVTESEDTESENMHLGFAFLWDTDKFNLHKDISENEVMPSIYHATGSVKFKRSPFYGRFVPKNLPKTELRLINVHSKSGGHGQTHDEFKSTAGKIYSDLCISGDGGNMSVYTIILGDYNLSAAECLKDEKVLAPMFPNYAVTRQDRPTHIKRDNKDNKEYRYYYQRDLDHCGCGDKHLEGRAELSVKQVDAVSRYMNGSFEDYYKHISDHVPVRLELTINRARRG